MWRQGLERVKPVAAVLKRVWYGCALGKGGGDVTRKFRVNYDAYLQGSGPSFLIVKDDFFDDETFDDNSTPQEAKLRKRLWIEIKSGSEEEIVLKGPYEQEQRVDFSSLHVCRYEWVMLLNDSLLFPLHGIDNMSTSILKMRRSADFWGHWDNTDIRWHLICTPCEYKMSMCFTMLDFMSRTMEECHTGDDFICKLETCQTEYLISKGFQWNVLVPHETIQGPTQVCIRSHHPFCKDDVIRRPETFAVKWKYVISYLAHDSRCVSPTFRYLARYLWFGHKGLISKGEQMGSFPRAADYHDKFLCAGA